MFLCLSGAAYDGPYYSPSFDFDSDAVDGLAPMMAMPMAESNFVAVKLPVTVRKSFPETWLWENVVEDR